jgi:hypothetical protein
MLQRPFGGHCLLGQQWLPIWPAFTNIEEINGDFYGDESTSQAHSAVVMSIFHSGSVFYAVRLDLAGLTEDFWLTELAANDYSCGVWSVPRSVAEGTAVSRGGIQALKGKRNDRGS